ncbi:MAG: threonine/serine exporter family protein, partial [Pseudomonadota bacterium]
MDVQHPAPRFDDRVRFLCELARRLHQAGTSAPRLESAIDHVAARLSLRCPSLSTPTSVILSVAD